MLKTLTKQGYIDNNDVAFEMASTVCEKGKPPEIPKKDIEAKDNKIDEQELNQLIEKKVQQKLYDQNKKFENVLTTVCNELQQLITNNKKELESLKRQVKERIVEKKEVQKTIPSEDKKAEPHPRQGNYTSDDVALDKIFYYGQK